MALCSFYGGRKDNFPQTYQTVFANVQSISTQREIHFVNERSVKNFHGTPILHLLIFICGYLQKSVWLVLGQRDHATVL